MPFVLGADLIEECLVRAPGDRLVELHVGDDQYGAGHVILCHLIIDGGAEDEVEHGLDIGG